ncbi:hypothetical protein [Micromonospora sp. NPDC049645]|uniref:hypothetical protein n=1 Tax=Micromonospora sp. NPDC049645 TaxID=3155508 RepID=UPI00342F4681
MAELLLLANPTAITVRGDGTSLHIDFDSIAELRSWLHLAGLSSTDLLTTPEREYTDSDGRPYRTVSAYPTWHGWEIFAFVREYTDSRTQLDASTVEQLAAMAVA